MKKIVHYLETSIFGFYFDKNECNETKRQKTRKLFDQIMEGKIIGCVSDLVLDEINKTPDVILREDIFNLIKEHNLPILRANETEISHLSKL